MADKVIIHEYICEQLNDIYKKKNSDYGSSFSKTRKEFGNVAILIRLSDKLERLKTLMLGAKQEVNDESIADTLMDLANYAIMELVEMQCDEEESVMKIW